MPPPMDTVQVRAACSMQGQALLAATSFGLATIASRSFACAVKRERGSSASCEPKESCSTSSGGKIKQNLLPIYPGAVAKLVGRTSPTEIRKLCLRDLLATILGTLSARQQRLHPSWPEWLTQPICATAALAHTLPCPGRAAHILGAPQRTLSRCSVREANVDDIGECAHSRGTRRMATRARPRNIFSYEDRPV